MFPMRSWIESFLILLAGAGIVPALASCGSEGASPGDVDHASQMTASAVAPATDTTREATPAVARAAPVTDALHFDLYCEVRGRIVSDPNPWEVHGTYPANEPTWRDHPHFMVDLQTMQICDSSACERYGPVRIVGATADRITIFDDPGLTIVIRRRDWHYDQRQEDMGRISVTRGQCVPARFSGFAPGVRMTG